MNLFRIIPGYEGAVFDAGREPAFLMLLTFIITLAGTRFYTRIGRIRSWGSGSTGGVHVHHLVPGVIMSLAAGVLVIAFEPGGILIGLLAAVFGAGAALTLDEFAILLHLDDVYWKLEGRLSIEACMVAVSALGLAVLVASPFEEGGANGVSWSVVFGLTINGLFVLMAIVKGKLKLGLIGIVVPFLALVGALRLAKPGSIWARFYPEHGRRMRRSRVRQAKREATWAARRNRFYDLIGGTPHL